MLVLHCSLYDLRNTLFVWICPKCFITHLVRGERNGQLNFFSPYFFFLFFSLLPNFFGRFSLLPDFSPFSLISLLRGLFYLLLHRSASFPRVLKEGKHTKHFCHVDISRSSHTTFRFCHVSLKL